MALYTGEELDAIRAPKVELECYLSGHMSAIVVHTQKPDKYSWWPNSTMGASIVGDPLYDRLLQKTGKKVKITIEEL